MDGTACMLKLSSSCLLVTAPSAALRSSDLTADVYNRLAEGSIINVDPTERLPKTMELVKVLFSGTISVTPAAHTLKR